MARTHRRQRSKTHCYNPYPMIYDPDPDSTPLAAAIEDGHPPRPESPSQQLQASTEDAKREESTQTITPTISTVSILFNEIIEMP